MKSRFFTAVATLIINLSPINPLAGTPEDIQSQAIDSNLSPSTDDTKPSTTVSTPQPTVGLKTTAADAWYRHFGLRWDGVFYGPSITDINTYQPDLYHQNSYGDALQFPIFVRNSWGATYSLSNGLVVGATFRMDVLPCAQGRDYYVDDSYVRIMSPKLINGGHFTMSGDLRVYFPTSHFSRTVGQSLSVMTQFIPTYTIPNSRFSIGAIVRQQSYTHYSWVNSDAMNTDAYAGPNVTYQITPTVTFGVLYEFEAVHYHGTGATDFTTENPNNPAIITPTDVEPNVSWDITPNVNLTPFLNFYPGGKFNLDTTSVGFFFGAKFL